MQKEFVIQNFKRFRPYLVANAPLQRLHTGFCGPKDRSISPTWAAPVQRRSGRTDFSLSSTGQRADRLPQPSGNANGNTRDRQGRLLTCESGNRRVTRTEHDGRITVSSPNITMASASILRMTSLCSSDDVDLVYRSRLRNPQRLYGKQGPERDRRRCVFRFDPREGKLVIATDELGKPNGLAFSPDEKILYVADSSVSHDQQGGPRDRGLRCLRRGELSRAGCSR